MSALARTSDPSPSHDGAVKHDRAACRSEAMERAKLLTKQYGDFTASEVGYDADLPESRFPCESLRKRAGEIDKEPTVKRACRITGSTAQAYRIADHAGHDKPMTRRTPNEND